MSRLLAPGPGGPAVGALPRGRSDFGDSAGCWSGVVWSLRSGGKGAGTPTASTAARWPLRHPSRGHCHHRNRRSSRVGGPEDVAATQPAWSGGHSAQKTTRGCSHQAGGCTPHHAHPLVTLVWAGQHPSAPSPAPAGTPWNLPCPHLGVTGSVSHPDCARLCPPGQPDPARQLCYLGHRPKNLKDCLDLLNVAAFVCFLPSVFQILRFLPSVLQIFRV